MPTVVCKREDWWEIVEAARKEWNQPDASPYRCLLHYGICRRSIITALSAECLRMFNRCGGLQVRTPQEYAQLPAFWTAVCETIELQQREIQIANGD